VAVTGAEPLFFLDYFATSSLDVGIAEDVIRGIAEGCREAGCALLGGETAEMPGMYAPGEYDLAGFCVGVVERDQVKDGSSIEPGDALIGLASTGLHSNGHSLARKILLEVLGLGLDDHPPSLGGASVADELLRPTRIYVPAFRALAGAGIHWKGAAHITGGGLIDNPPRMFGARKGELAVELDSSTWSRPGVFALITSSGVAEEEMRRTFNLGLGMVIAVADSEVDRAVAALAAAGQNAARVGTVRRRTGAEPGVTVV